MVILYLYYLFVSLHVGVDRLAIACKIFCAIVVVCVINSSMFVFCIDWCVCALLCSINNYSTALNANDSFVDCLPALSCSCHPINLFMVISFEKGIVCSALIDLSVWYEQIFRTMLFLFKICLSMYAY